MGIPEKIKAIQDEIHRTQLNKATEHHIGLLKAKIAKLKREQESIAIKKSSKKSDGFDVKRTGDATVVFIGLPSVGKSTLLNKLTGSKSAIGAFQFTTLTVVPGVLEHRGARIQMLDLPGIIKGASSGKGLGRRILSVARSADIVLLVLDVFQPYHENVLINELNNIGLVVGATQSEDMIRIKNVAPSLTWLIPGIGAQGGNLRDSVRICSQHDGVGISNVSRGIIYAGDGSLGSISKATEDYTKEIRSYL